LQQQSRKKREEGRNCRELNLGPCLLEGMVRTGPALRGRRTHMAMGSKPAWRLIGRRESSWKAAQATLTPDSNVPLIDRPGMLLDALVESSPFLFFGHYSNLLPQICP
jgi:hypothetical protein